ncbi:MAG: hypothetical protein ACTSX1_04535, partial [Candidatus Heimdallarchaeaceae archaeon]
APGKKTKSRSEVMYIGSGGINEEKAGVLEETVVAFTFILENGIIPKIKNEKHKKIVIETLNCLKLFFIYLPTNILFSHNTMLQVI